VAPSNLIFLLVRRTDTRQEQLGAYGSVPAARAARTARIEAGDRAAALTILGVPLAPADAFDSGIGR
jgi:hypothetical protein